MNLQSSLSLADAVAEYVGLITGQRGVRLGVLLARTGLGGRHQIAGGDTGRMLGVSYQRIYQLEQQLDKHRCRTVAPAGVWMPKSREHSAARGPNTTHQLAPRRPRSSLNRNHNGGSRCRESSSGMFVVDD